MGRGLLLQQQHIRRGLQEGPAQWKGDGIFRQRVKVRRGVPKWVQEREGGGVLREWQRVQGWIQERDKRQGLHNVSREGRSGGREGEGQQLAQHDHPLLCQRGHEGEQVPERSAGRLTIGRISFIIFYIPNLSIYIGSIQHSLPSGRLCPLFAWQKDKASIEFRGSSLFLTGKKIFLNNSIHRMMNYKNN